MTTAQPFVIEEDGSEAVATEVRARLRSFNERIAGPLNTKPLVLGVRDQAGTVIGGLVGEFFWNTLLVEVLWVDEPHRNNGMGTALLTRAEKLAREHLCDSIYLSSFTFQAPAFCAKKGYMTIGKLAGVPKGSAWHWLAKPLHTNAV
jgi:GNAT superfamily N-acetyltransferase